MTDQRIEKWRSWCDGDMKNDILSMHLQRDTWEQFQQIIRDNGPFPDSYWWEFMRDTYGITQAVAVRRQTDTHKDVATLGKLVSEISTDAGLITREFWIGLWDTTDKFALMRAEDGWATQFGGDVGTHLDPAIPVADMTDLSDASAKVNAYVDKHLAHLDRKPVPATDLPTLDDVHDAIDKIGDLYRKYYNLLTASFWVLLVPAIQHDWKAIFRQPWIKSGY